MRECSRLAISTSTIMLSQVALLNLESHVSRLVVRGWGLADGIWAYGVDGLWPMSFKSHMMLVKILPVGSGHLRA